MESINHAAQTVFDGLDTKVKLKYKTPPTYLITVYLENHLVAEFCLSTDTMFITAIHKYKGVSGSIILDKVELFARTVGVKTISLNDASCIYISGCDDVNITLGIDIEISLQTLYLLTAGMSWYNSKGYIDEKLEDVDGIKRVDGIRRDDINMPMDTFMQNVITSLIKNEDFVYYKANHNTFEDTVDSQGNPTNYIYQLLSRINTIVPELLHTRLLVKDYFNIVKTLLKTPTPTPDDCRLFILFKELIRFIDNSFLLLRDLNGSTKILAGIKGWKKRTCKKCLKNKKHRRHSKKMQKSKKKRQILTFNLNDIK